ncbi:hypothetical protein PS685_01886 [Pseudomonas fluorescens]|uniref:Uncharacterized protein n=1 Tax=Pseudomonas fluorescens TaxID=294 RepID=A0A5E6YS46_PSEFL|nr:hypothetical protein PS685_01886 [Pseudomonas fluorescens]
MANPYGITCNGCGFINTPNVTLTTGKPMVGGLLAETMGGDFKTGALAGGVNEALVGHLNDLVNGDEKLLTMSSQIVGVLAAAA